MNPEEAALYWAEELDASKDSLVRLKGGINNYVFRCGDIKHFWIIKKYPTIKLHQRSRMQAEVEFLQYAHLVAPKRIPELIAIDNDRSCVILEYINGISYAEGASLTLEDQQTALSFFDELNTHKETARLMITMGASEGFLRLTEHMKNIYNRIKSMSSSHLPLNVIKNANMIIDMLNRKADVMEKHLQGLLVNGEAIDTLDPNLRCVSPSDFGFHNAIKTSQGVKFIDFEFAGWDDPAKAKADYFLQPKVPVDKNKNLSFSGWLKNDHIVLESRFNILLCLMRLKWACIILGVLNPNRLQEILSLNNEMNLEILVSERIVLAMNYLSE